MCCRVIADNICAWVGRMCTHDALIFGLPLFLKVFEFGLAHHFVKARPKMRRDTARLTHPFTDKAQCLWQILWPNDQKRHKDDKQQFG